MGTSFRISKDGWFPASARRASSERTRPAVLRWTRAISLTARSTSSSRFNVVLMHLASHITHHMERGRYREREPGLYQIDVVMDYGADGVGFDTITLEVEPA